MLGAFLVGVVGVLVGGPGAGAGLGSIRGSAITGAAGGPGAGAGSGLGRRVIGSLVEAVLARERGSGLGWRVVPLVGSLVVVPLEGAGPRRTVCRRASVPADGCPILLQGSGFGRNAQEESLMFRVLLRCRYR